MYKGLDTPICINIDNKYGSMAYRELTLIHELTHYHLYRTGQEFRDGTPEFIKECNLNGVYQDSVYQDVLLVGHLKDYKEEKI